MLELSAYPRLRLSHAPTPLEPMARLRDVLLSRTRAVPQLWIKRDDATGLALGGNKTRKLEFLVGEALSVGADSVITYGATQSNHVRQTAAAAARAGLECHVLLEERVRRDLDYATSGNVLLDQILGASIARLVPPGGDMLAEARELESRLTDRGGRPYLIVGGGSSPRGALGYAVAAEEIANQVDASVVVHATGSMGTQAGLLAGFGALGASTRVLGVSVRQSAAEMSDDVASLATDTAALLGVSTGFDPVVEIDDRWVGEGYGVPTAAMVDAVRTLARTEGILLDPVYSGKAFAGLLGMIDEGRFSTKENVVFVHTGGAPALFAYRSTFADEQMASQSG